MSATEWIPDLASWATRAGPIPLSSPTLTPVRRLSVAMTPDGTPELGLGPAPALASWALMSYRCEICGKEPSYGRTVSFSHKSANRRWLPNIQKIRVKHGSNTRRARVCTSCIRAGKVVKA